MARPRSATHVICSGPSAPPRACSCRPMSRCHPGSSGTVARVAQRAVRRDIVSPPPRDPVSRNACSSCRWNPSSARSPLSLGSSRMSDSLSRTTGSFFILAGIESIAALRERAASKGGGGRTSVSSELLMHRPSVPGRPARTGRGISLWWTEPSEAPPGASRIRPRCTWSCCSPILPSRSVPQ